VKIAAIQKRGIFVTLDFHINEILMLAALMDKAIINVDPENKIMVEGAKWLHEVLEPQLKWFQDKFEMEDYDGSDNSGDESQKVG
jgi:hypothetical protein